MYISSQIGSVRVRPAELRDMLRDNLSGIRWDYSTKIQESSKSAYIQS